MDYLLGARDLLALESAVRTTFISQAHWFPSRTSCHRTKAHTDHAPSARRHGAGGRQLPPLSPVPRTKPASVLLSGKLGTSYALAERTVSVLLAVADQMGGFMLEREKRDLGTWCGAPSAPTAGWHPCLPHTAVPTTHLRAEPPLPQAGKCLFICSGTIQPGQPHVAAPCTLLTGLSSALCLEKELCR